MITPPGVMLVAIRECGTRRIDRGEAAARRPKEAVRHATCVDVRSGDHSGRGDAVHGLAPGGSNVMKVACG